MDPPWVINMQSFLVSSTTGARLCSGKGLSHRVWTDKHECNVSLRVKHEGIYVNIRSGQWHLMLQGPCSLRRWGILTFAISDLRLDDRISLEDMCDRCTSCVRASQHWD